MVFKKLFVLAALASAVFGAIVPENGQPSKLTNVATGLAADLYHVGAPIIGDPVVSRPSNILPSQNWCTYINDTSNRLYNPIIFKNQAEGLDISVSDAEGDGLVVKDKGTVFELYSLVLPDPTYLILKDGLAVTGGPHGAQLTLEALDPDNAAQRWKFYVPITTGIGPQPPRCPNREPY